MLGGLSRGVFVLAIVAVLFILANTINAYAAPIFYGVTPDTATIGELTTFTVSGQYLPRTLAFFIPGCTDIIKTKPSSISPQFQCTPTYGIGSQKGVLKTRPNGTLISYFYVDYVYPPSISSFYPTTTTLNQQTTFTVTGSNLPSTLALYIPECEYTSGQGNMYHVQGYSSTKHQFRCTPKFTTGPKTAEIKDKPGGKLLDTTTVNVVKPKPSISSFYPTTATLNQQTTFTVTGSYLPNTLSIHVPGCEYTLGQGDIYHVPGYSSTQHQFICTQRYNPSDKTILVKDQSGGTTLKTYTLTVQTPAPVVNSVSPTSTRFGDTRTFTIYGSNLPSSTAHFITDCADNTRTSYSTSQIQFRCRPKYTAGIHNITIKKYSNAPGTPLYQGTVNVYTNSYEYSVTPTSVPADQDTIDFTITGPFFSDTTAFEIDKCSTMTPLPGATEIQRQYRCTSTKQIGSSNGRIKDHWDENGIQGGRIIKSFNIDFFDNSPIISSVTPSSAEIDTQTTFDVIGTNLPSTLAFFVPGCEYTPGQGDTYHVPGYSSTKHQFRCTPTYSLGQQKVVVKDKPGDQGGIQLHPDDKFSVSYGCNNDQLSHWWTAENHASSAISGAAGQLISGISFDTGINGSGFLLDGVDDYIDLGLGSAGEYEFGTGSFSVSAWIKTSVGGGTIIGKELYVDGWRLDLEIDGKPSFFTADNSQGQFVQIIGPNPITDGNWHHLTGVRNTEQQVVQLYVDGKLVATTHEDPGRNINRLDETLKIGRPTLLLIQAKTFEGTIDEIKIYRNVLSKPHIDQLYSEGFYGTCDTTIPNSPIIDSISSLTVELNTSTIFTVTGQNLPNTLAFWIEECEYTQGIGDIQRLPGFNENQHQFQCTFRHTTGTKQGVVKDRPDNVANGIFGNVLTNFSIDVVPKSINPPPTPSAGLVPPIKNFPKYNRKWDADQDGTTDYSTLYADNYLGFNPQISGEAEGNHAGVDISVATNTEIHAIGNGQVTIAGSLDDWGNIIIIKHTKDDVGITTLDEFYSIYAHLNSISVSVGQTVSKDQIIGLSGNTGESTGPHLHFQIDKPGPVHPYDGWTSIVNNAYSEIITQFTCNPMLFVQNNGLCTGPKKECPTSIDGLTQKCSCSFNSDCGNRYCSRELGLWQNTAFGACVDSLPVCGDNVCSSLESLSSCPQDCDSVTGKISIKVSTKDGVPLENAVILQNKVGHGYRTDSDGNFNLFVEANQQHEVEVFCSTEEFCGRQFAHFTKEEANSYEKYMPFTCDCDLSTLDTDGDGFTDYEEKLMGTNISDKLDNFDNAFIFYGGKSLILNHLIPGGNCFSSVASGLFTDQEIEQITKKTQSMSIQEFESVFSDNKKSIQQFIVQSGIDPSRINQETDDFKQVLQESSSFTHANIGNNIVYFVEGNDGKTHIFSFYEECVGEAVGLVYGAGGGIYDDVGALKDIATLVWWAIWHVDEVYKKAGELIDEFDKVWEAIKQIPVGISAFAWETVISIFEDGSNVASYLNIAKQTNDFQQFQWNFFIGYVKGYLVEQVVVGKGIASAAKQANLAIKSLKISDRITSATIKSSEKLAKISKYAGYAAVKAIKKLPYWDVAKAWSSEVLEGLGFLQKHKGTKWLADLGSNLAKEISQNIANYKAYARSICVISDSSCVNSALNRLGRIVGSDIFKSEYLFKEWSSESLYGLALTVNKFDDDVFVNWFARNGDDAAERVFEHVGRKGGAWTAIRIEVYLNLMDLDNVQSSKLKKSIFKRYGDEAFFDHLDLVDEKHIKILRDHISKIENPKTREHIIDIVKLSNPDQLEKSMNFLTHSQKHYDDIQKIKFEEFKVHGDRLSSILTNELDSGTLFGRKKLAENYEEKVARKLKEILEGKDDINLLDSDFSVVDSDLWKKLDKDFNGFSYIVENKQDLEKIIKSLVDNPNYAIDFGNSKSYDMSTFLNGNLKTDLSSNQNFLDFIKTSSSKDSGYRGIHFEMFGTDGARFELKFQTKGQKAISEFEHSTYKARGYDTDFAIDEIIKNNPSITSKQLTDEIDIFFKSIYDDLYDLEFNAQTDFKLFHIQDLVDAKGCPRIVQQLGKCDFSENNLLKLLDKTDLEGGIPSW